MNFQIPKVVKKGTDNFRVAVSYTWFVKNPIIYKEVLCDFAVVFPFVYLLREFLLLFSFTPVVWCFVEIMSL